MSHSWEEFLTFLYQLPSKLKPGRQGIRVVRDHLQSLVEHRVLMRLTEVDQKSFFPLGFSPAESDLKVAAGLGIERGYISPVEYEDALKQDKAAGPFGFLQTLSGKVFGETVAPQIAQFWLQANLDLFSKRPPSGLYDLLWTDGGSGRTIRIELKASTEDSPNFQQIRHPRMTNRDAEDYEYDILLCLHVSNAGLEWWVFPAAEVADLIHSGVFTSQHGGQKIDSGTYWIRMTPQNRVRFEANQTTSEELRGFIQDQKAKL